MKVPEETICTICHQIFCCAKCRVKHEQKTHAIIIRNRNKINQNGNETGQTKTDAATLPQPLTVLCALCANKPFPLHEIIYTEVLEHIKRHHLPLQCQKCTKLYTTIDELQEFTKCVNSQFSAEAVDCTFNIIESDKMSIKTIAKNSKLPYSTIKQTSPIMKAQTDDHLTPLVEIQILSKISRDISDSVSSLKNISSIDSSSCLRRSIGTAIKTDTKGKLVRSTSTPVHADIEYAKPKEQTFNVTGGQVSSIYSSGCDIENNKNNSPNTHSGRNKTGLYFIDISQTVGAQQHQPENVYRKLGGRTKLTATTPLRHVMSKSIQKAFAEHGLRSFTEQKQLQRLETNETSGQSSNSPLDLRLSPAIRRGQADVNKLQQIKKEKTRTSTSITTATVTQSCTISTKKIVQKSIVFRRLEKLVDVEDIEEASYSDSAVSSTSNDSVYKTCESIQIVATSDAEQVNSNTENTVSLVEKGAQNKLLPQKLLNAQKNLNYLAPITPIARIPGAAVNKKLIKFETPKEEDKSGDDKFYTPKTSPDPNYQPIKSPDSKSNLEQCTTYAWSKRFSPSRRPSIHEWAQSTTYNNSDTECDSNNEVFHTPQSSEKLTKEIVPAQSMQTASGFLSSLMNSVMRLTASKGANLQNNKSNLNLKSKQSIIKRCASIAGSLVRSKSLVDEHKLQSLKRKRTNTFDCPMSPLTAVRRMESMPQFDHLSASKRFRIQPRKPIERMRNHSQS